MTKDWLLYVGQKAVIEKDGKILFLVDPIIDPDLPGGKLVEGETDYVAALKREIHEETGISVDVMEAFYSWHFEFPKEIKHRNSGKQVYCIAFRCKYRSGKVKLSDEHTSYKWIDKRNFRKYTKGSNYQKVLEKYFSSS